MTNSLNEISDTAASMCGQGVHEGPEGSYRGRTGHSEFARCPEMGVETIAPVAPDQLASPFPRATIHQDKSCAGFPRRHGNSTSVSEGPQQIVGISPRRGGHDQVTRLSPPMVRSMRIPEPPGGGVARSPGRTPVGHSRVTPPARPVRVSGSSTWGACAAAPPPRGSR